MRLELAACYSERSNQRSVMASLDIDREELLHFALLSASSIGPVIPVHGIARNTNGVLGLYLWWRSRMSPR